MRKTLLALAAAVSLIGLPGCIKFKQGTVINKDGSGTATLRMVQLTKPMEELKTMLDGMGMGGEGGMGGMSDQMGMGGFDDLLDVEKTKKKIAKTKGVELVSAKAIDNKEAGEKGAEYTVKFANLKALATLMSDDGKAEGIMLKKDKAGNYTLIMGDASEPG